MGSQTEIVGLMIRARPATMDDAQIIFEWRNDPVTISTSRSGNGIDEWETHVSWMIDQLNRESIACIIVENAMQNPIGVVWFRQNRSAVWETSVNMAPEYRGKGLSVPMLTCAMAWMRERYHAIRFSTEVKKGNAASVKMFERCGFQYVHPSPDFETYAT